MIGNTQLHAELGKVPASVCQLRKPHDTDTEKTLQQQWEMVKARESAAVL